MNRIKSIRACITLRPKIYNFIKQQALKEQLSISRYLEKLIEKELEKVLLEVEKSTKLG